ncbi:MAG: hypothetical protein WBZ36_00015 [Candidatus Nitrosopolaris sp.]
MKCRTVFHAEKGNGLSSRIFIMNRAIYILIIYGMQVTGVVVLVGLNIILFEVFPEKSIWSIPVTQADEHMIAVPPQED